VLTTLASMLGALIRQAKHGLQRNDAYFALRLIKDAEALKWERNTLEKRKRVVRSMIMEHMSSLDRLPGGSDDLFRKKGWNMVDSSFKLWGGESSKSAEDDFLASKGWNNVESGFRLI